jgi:biotin carboxyl carrier protein
MHIDIATKLAGRIEAVLLREGDLVEAGVVVGAWIPVCCARS